mmetsp:Transcript_8727/g.16370  ORF Transcript_8727/g.16370 Transcript_8727/m.16370 type:complete len:200 (-) Transcript_8727:122-721(-)
MWGSGQPYVQVFRRFLVIYHHVVYITISFRTTQSLTQLDHSQLSTTIFRKDKICAELYTYMLILFVKEKIDLGDVECRDYPISHDADSHTSGVSCPWHQALCLPTVLNGVRVQGPIPTPFSDLRAPQNNNVVLTTFIEIQCLLCRAGNTHHDQESSLPIFNYSRLDAPNMKLFHAITTQRAQVYVFRYFGSRSKRINLR